MLTSVQLVNTSSAYRLTRRFIATFTNACHLSLSWASSIQSTPPHPTYCKSISLLSSHLRLGIARDLFPPGFLPKPCIRLSLSHMRYMPHRSHSNLCYHSHNTGWQVKKMKFPLHRFLHSPATSSPLGPKCGWHKTANFLDWMRCLSDCHLLRLQSPDFHETEFQRPAVSRRNESNCGNLGIQILPETHRHTCCGWTWKEKVKLNMKFTLGV